MANGFDTAAGREQVLTAFADTMDGGAHEGPFTLERNAVGWLILACPCGAGWRVHVSYGPGGLDFDQVDGASSCDDLEKCADCGASTSGPGETHTCKE